MFKKIVELKRRAFARQRGTALLRETEAARLRTEMQEVEATQLRAEIQEAEAVRLRTQMQEAEAERLRVQMREMDAALLRAQLQEAEAERLRTQLQEAEHRVREAESRLETLADDGNNINELLLSSKVHSVIPNAEKNSLTESEMLFRIK